MPRKRTAGTRWTIAGLVLLALVSGSVVVASLTQGAANSQHPNHVSTPVPIPTRSIGTVALWVGDSYTEGSGAAGSAYAYPHLVAVDMGWTEAVDAQGGTGFISDGTNNVLSNVPVPERLDRFTGTPKYVIVDAGRNDGAADFETQTAPAVRGYLDAVKAKWPEAKIVLIVPSYITSSGPFQNFMDLYAEQAARVGAVVIDPLAEGWLQQDAMTDMVYSDGIHPNKAGHEYIAEHLVERLKMLGITPVS